MASEDSDQLVSGFAVVHRLRDLGNLDETLSGHMPASSDDFHASRELLEVMSLLCPQRILTEEWNDRIDQLRASTYEILAEMLAMVVVAAIDEDPTDAEEAFQLLQAPAAL